MHRALTAQPSKQLVRRAVLPKFALGHQHPVQIAALRPRLDLVEIALLRLHIDLR